jgi:hypothetical protein
MHCKHCGFANGEDDHRCLQCGRRLSGVVITAPAGYSGANALALAPLEESQIPEPAPAQAAMFHEARQARVAGNLIEFPAQPVGAAAKPAQPPARTAQKKTIKPPVEQGTLDFIPARSRKLKTDVDAQIFCDLPVATPTHRCVASAIDAAVILLGFGLLVLVFQLLGGSFGEGKLFWLGLGSSLALVSLFYGLLWVIAGRETAGMHFTDLELITFDGFPLDARSRTLRFASSWLSFCSGGLGLVWAVADEENLTWHDHISKTFPTIREAPRSFVKQRR